MRNGAPDLDMVAGSGSAGGRAFGARGGKPDGHPIARSTVELEPIGGTPGRPLAARTRR